MTDKPNKPTDLDGSFDAELDTFFAQARSSTPEPSPDLMARILADALEAQPAPPLPPVPARPAYNGGMSELWDALGGWPAAASLVTATVAGIWIGISPPDAVSTVTETFGLSEIALLETDDSFMLDSFLEDG